MCCGFHACHITHPGRQGEFFLAIPTVPLAFESFISCVAYGMLFCSCVMATLLLQLVVFHMYAKHIRVSDNIPEMPFCNPTICLSCWQLLFLKSSRQSSVSPLIFWPRCLSYLWSLKSDTHSSEFVGDIPSLHHIISFYTIILLKGANNTDCLCTGYQW